MSVTLRRDTPPFATAVNACAAALGNDTSTDGHRACTSQVTAYLYNNRRRIFQLVRGLALVAEPPHSRHERCAVARRSCVTVVL